MQTTNVAIGLPQSAPPRTIQVTLLLTGGHRYTLSLQANSPLLTEIMGIVAANAQFPAVAPTLLQLYVNDDSGVLCFPSHHLVGVITEPPVHIQTRLPQTLPTLPPTQPPAIPQQPPSRPMTDGAQAQALPPNLLTSDYILFDDFLSPQDTQALLDYVLKRQKEFEPSSVTTSESDYRHSLVLHFFPKFSELMLQKVRAHCPEALHQLKLPEFEIEAIEAQLTAHNDGDYFKLHNDNGSPDTANRVLTYVYYFHRQPRGFSGGELKLYDSLIQNGQYTKADSFHLIEPLHNRIIFFPSRYLHEVLQIRCPSKAFADSRFTINGWVRRKI